MREVGFSPPRTKGNFLDKFTVMLERPLAQREEKLALDNEDNGPVSGCATEPRRAS